MALTMGLQTKGPPDAMDGGSGKFGFFSYGTDCPVCAICGFGIEGLTNQKGHFFI